MMADKELADRIAAAVEDAEATSDDELHWARHQEPVKSPTAVYSVRIPVDRIEQLRQLAAERGVQPTALIRTWVLTQLDAARNPENYPWRWERDVRATADRLRKLLDEHPGVPWADVSPAAAESGAEYQAPERGAKNMSMPAPVDQPAIQCFLSYAHGDEAALSFIDEFKAALSHYAYSDRGRRVEIFVDHDSIGWGEEWHQKIRDSVESALVFIPIVTVQYLSRPLCREELMLFFEGASELGVTELCLPVVVLGHRFISEDSDDPVAERIAKMHFKDLRDAVLQGTDSATWRVKILEIANSLVDAVESAEERLAAGGSAVKPQVAPVVEGDAEIDDDSLGLEELGDEVAKAGDEVGRHMARMTELVELVAEVITPESEKLKASAGRRSEMTAILLRIANKLAPLSTQIEEVGSYLEVRIAEMDRLLRSAWDLARDHGGPEIAASLRDSIVSGVSEMSALEESERQISEFLEGMKPVEVMSVPLRKAVRPMRKGVTSFQSAISTMRSWSSITDG